MKFEKSFSLKIIGSLNLVATFKKLNSILNKHNLASFLLYTKDGRGILRSNTLLIFLTTVAKLSTVLINSGILACFISIKLILISIEPVS